MRSRVLASALASALLAGSVSAAPQDIDFDLADAVPNPTYTTTLSQVTYDATAILESALPQITSQVTDDTNAVSTDAPAVDKRAATACAPQPTGAGPVPSPDTASAFLNFASFSSAAVNAPTPSGYSQTFSNLQASNNAYGYMGYSLLQTYDPVACANRCNAINGCMSINVFFERDPSVDPGTGSTGCANPSSTTSIKCVYWGGPVTPDNALNKGQYRNQFQVVITGSNGYTNNSIATPPGYTGPALLGNAAINAPLDQYGMDSYLGSAIFNSGPFNVQLCADACSQKSAYAVAHPPTDGSPVQTCQFFNTYILYVNTTKNLQGQYCAMYSETWPAKYATNVGQYRSNAYGGNDHYLIEFSMSFFNTTNPGVASPDAAVHQASKDISYSTLQPFCSSLLSYTTPVTTTTTMTTVTSSPSSVVTETSSPSTLVVATSTPVTAVSVAVATSVITVGPPSSSPAAGPSKRSAVVLSTPAALTRYPSAILSSACSLQATPVSLTSVSVTTTTTTTTLPTSISTTILTLSTVTSFTTTTLSSTSTNTVDFTTTTTTTTAPAAATPTDCILGQQLGTFGLQASYNSQFATICGALSCIEQFDFGAQSAYGAGVQFGFDNDCNLNLVFGSGSTESILVYPGRGQGNSEVVQRGTPSSYSQSLSCFVDASYTLYCSIQGTPVSSGVYNGYGSWFVDPSAEDLTGMGYTVFTLKAVPITAPA